MDRITSTELQRDFGRVLSNAKRKPIMVTSRGRDEVVILDVSEYERLKIQALQTAIDEGLASGEPTALDMNEIKQAARHEAGLNAE